MSIHQLVGEQMEALLAKGGYRLPGGCSVVTGEDFATGKIRIALRVTRSHGGEQTLAEYAFPGGTCTETPEDIAKRLVAILMLRPQALAKTTNRLEDVNTIEGLTQFLAQRLYDRLRIQGLNIASRPPEMPQRGRTYSAAINMDERHLYHLRAENPGRLGLALNMQLNRMQHALEQILRHATGYYCSVEINYLPNVMSYQVRVRVEVPTIIEGDLSHPRIHRHVP